MRRRRTAIRVALVAAVLAALGVATVALATTPLAAPTISAFPANPTNATSASFTYTDAQAITKFQCRLDGASYSDCGTTRPSTKNYSGLSAGSHTFEVRAVSGSQTSSATPYTWLIDRTAPTVVSINRAGPSPSNAASVQWTVTFSENVTGPAIANFSLVNGGLGGSPAVTGVSGSGATRTVTASTGTGSGTLQLRLSSVGTIKDIAGNALSGSLPFNGQTYAIDKTAPNPPTILGPLPFPPFGWPFTTAPFLFLDNSPDVASYQCKLDAGAFVACSNPKLYPGLAEGPHSLQVKAVDNAGNVSAATTPYPFFIDTAAPNTPTLTSFPPDPGPPASAQFAWTDTDPAPGTGIALYLCKLDGGIYLPCSSPKTYTNLTFGSHTFKVIAVDWAGNISNAATYGWEVSEQGMPFTIAGDASGLLYPGAPLTPIALTITNPNNVPIYVTSMTVTVTNDPNGCTNLTNVVLQQSNVAPTVNELMVPANAVAFVVPAPMQPRIRLTDTGANQDNCQTQTFSLSYTGSAHS